MFEDNKAAAAAAEEEVKVFLIKTKNMRWC